MKTIQKKILEAATQQLAITDLPFASSNQE
jgi:hypothetical protein